VGREGSPSTVSLSPGACGDRRRDRTATRGPGALAP
jgi:hypothetical protein